MIDGLIKTRDNLAAKNSFDKERIQIFRDDMGTYSMEIDGKEWSSCLHGDEIEDQLYCIFKGMEIMQKGDVMDGRIEKVDSLIHQITELLPCIYDSEVTDEYKATRFLTSPDGTEILSAEENEIETLANFFDQLYGEGTVNTGYYDPEEDKRNGEVDAYTGLYYVTVA